MRPILPLAIAALVLLVVISTATACHASIRSSSISRLTGSERLTVAQFVDGIVTRSADLTYITEQDSEVFAFYRNTPVKEVTDTVFLGLLRQPLETRVIQQPWPDFFRSRTSLDPTGKWRELQEYLEANMSNLAVFRIPREPPYGAQYDLYAVGLFNGKTIVGIQMFGVGT